VHEPETHSCEAADRRDRQETTTDRPYRAITLSTEQRMTDATRYPPRDNTPASRPARAVYVVARPTASHGHKHFVAAELTPGGGAREYPTPEAAHAAAARLGGRAAGVVVLEEWRTAAGLPCGGPWLES
jgi:hypothetical protein